MSEYFDYHDRYYILAGCIVGTCWVSYLFFRDMDVRSLAPVGQLIACVVYFAIPALSVMSFVLTSTVVVEDQGISKTMFGKRFGALPWDSVASIRFSIQKMYKSKPCRCATLRTKDGQSSFSVSEKFDGFDRFAALVTEIAQRRNIEIERSNDYPEKSSP